MRPNIEPDLRWRPGLQIFVQIEWENIPLQYQAQFSTYRWTVGYGETYDYQSIMHYSSRAFVRYNLHRN